MDSTHIYRHLCRSTNKSVSNSADKFETLSGLEILAVFGIGIFLHFVFLIITYTTSLKCFNFSLANRKAVVILGSQKTLPVALSVISFLPLALGSHGIISLPCIIAHFCQIVMDGVVAARWAEYVDDDAGGEEQQEQKDGGLLKDPKKKGEEQQRWQQQTPDVEVAAQKDESIELVV